MYYTFTQTATFRFDFLLRSPPLLQTFYAIYLSGGRVHVHLRLKRGAELHLVSPRNFYNDGSSHLVTVHRNGSK